MQMDLRLTKFVQVGVGVLLSEVTKMKIYKKKKLNSLFPSFCRKRTQALRFKMSFWSFYSGDNRGEKRGFANQ